MPQYTATEKNRPGQNKGNIVLLINTTYNICDNQRELLTPFELLNGLSSLITKHPTKEIIDVRQ
jgi:hypothetical protein